MRTPNRLGMYEDVKAILDSALVAGGGTFQLDSHGAAIHWRHRAYKFRKLYAETFAPAPSPYDRLTMPKIPKESAAVVIRLTAENQKGTFIPANEPAVEMDDEVLAFAKELSSKIGE